MLIRFAVENFMSFKGSTQFNMSAGKILRHSSHVVVERDRRILKSSFLFGANAGGKSNFVQAINFARAIVIAGPTAARCNKKYFRIDPEYKLRPGVFQFDIFSNGHFYSYGFAVSYATATIEEEWLYRTDDGEFCIFMRQKSKEEQLADIRTDLKFDSESQRERFKVYCDDVRSPKMERTLFLSDIALRSPDEDASYQPFRDVIAWFKRLVIVFPNSKYRKILELLGDDAQRTMLSRYMAFFDTGIENVLKKDMDFDLLCPNPEEQTELLNMVSDNSRALINYKRSLVEISKKESGYWASEIITDHGNDDDLFEYYDESDGTRRLFDLIPLYQLAMNGRIVIVDELDRSLHTKLTQEFIRRFYEVTADISTQLIATTQDSNIMDLEFLRQDEIWFVEREKDHSSKLYSLNQFKARFDKKVEKDYLIGRYGAIPVFNQCAISRADEGEEGDWNAE